MTAPVAAGVLLRVPCAAAASDLWFSGVPSEVEAAKAACGPCPLRVRCLSEAIGRAEPWGVWGGELVQDGVVVARKRLRGRPPKSQQRDHSSAAAAVTC